MSDRTRILVLTSCYLPGYKAGGPVRSISGMIQSLGDEFEFRVLTLDHDLGDRQPYPGVVRGAWTPVGKAQVMYLPTKLTRLDPLAQLIRRHRTTSSTSAAVSIRRLFFASCCCGGWG